MRLLLPLFVALAVLAVPGPGRAQTEMPFACGERSAGLVACVAGKLCACRSGRGGVMSGLPAGHGWDCGVLRPACGDAAYLPATLDPYPYPLPPALGIELPPHRDRR